MELFHMFLFILMNYDRKKIMRNIANKNITILLLVTFQNNKLAIFLIDD